MEDAIWEATASHRELIERLGLKVIRRRFRVEGSPAGNSRVLSKPLADKTAAKYGGSVVEVIPYEPPHIRRAKPMAECPRCGAPAGKPCKSKHGRLRDPHLARWNEFNDR